MGNGHRAERRTDHGRGGAVQTGLGPGAATASHLSHIGPGHGSARAAARRIPDRPHPVPGPDLDCCKRSGFLQLFNNLSAGVPHPFGTSIGQIPLAPTGDTQPRHTRMCDPSSPAPRPGAAGQSGGRRGVEPVHGGTGTLGQDEVDGVGRLLHRHVELGAGGLAGPAQHEVGARLATGRLADPDPHSDEVARVQVGLDRLEAVVARRAATDLHLDPAHRQVELVVHHHQPAQVLDAVPPHQACDRLPGEVHVRLREGDGHEPPVGPELGDLGLLPAFAQRAAVAVGQQDNHLGPQVVTGAVVLRPGVAEADDEEIRGLARSRRQRLFLGVGVALRDLDLDLGLFLFLGPPGRLGEDDGVLGVQVRGHAVGQVQVGHPDGVADNETGDVHLDGVGDVGRQGVDHQVEQLLLDETVGPLDLEGLADQPHRHLHADDLVAADDHEVDVGHRALQRVTLQLAGHGQVAGALDLQPDEGVETGFLVQREPEGLAVDGQGLGCDAVAVQHGRHLSLGPQPARRPGSGGTANLCFERYLCHERTSLGPGRHRSEQRVEHGLAVAGGRGHLQPHPARLHGEREGEECTAADLPHGEVGGPGHHCGVVGQPHPDAGGGPMALDRVSEQFGPRRRAVGGVVGGQGARCGRRRRGRELAVAATAGPAARCRLGGVQRRPHMVELSGKARQFGDPAPHLVDLAVQERKQATVQHRARAIGPQSDEVGDVVEREAHRLGPTDEPKTFDGLVVVHPISSLGPPRRGQQTDGLVVPQRRRGEPAAVGELGDPVSHTGTINL